MRIKRPPASIMLLSATLLIYAILSFTDTAGSVQSLKKAFDILYVISPSLVFMVILMTAMNYFVTPKQLSSGMGKGNSIYSWVVAIVAGIISAGPLYLWLPILNEFQKHGVNDSLLATFLFSRAIKLPLLALMIFYFGFTYTLVLNLLILVVSPIQGMTTQKMMELMK